MLLGRILFGVGMLAIYGIVFLLESLLGEDAPPGPPPRPTPRPVFPPPSVPAAPAPAPAAQFVGRAVSAPGDTECQVCGEALKRELVACTACATLTHETCWSYAGGCSTYACGERPRS